MGRRVMYAAIPVLIFAGIVAPPMLPESEARGRGRFPPRNPTRGPPGAAECQRLYHTRRRATIAAKITGRVTGVFFDEGTRVAQGQLLATLDESDVKRAFDSAKADRDSAQAAIADYEVQLRNAQIGLHRAEQLQKAGVQTQEALDNAGTAADSLKAKIALAKQQVAASEARIA